MFWEDISGETQAQPAACGWEVAGAKGLSFDTILTWWSIYKLNVKEAACEVLNFQVACWWCGVPKQRFPAISPLRIMGSRNWWFGDPRTLLYRVKPLYRRVQWFSGIYDICIILMKFCVCVFFFFGAKIWGDEFLDCIGRGITPIWLGTPSIYEYVEPRGFGWGNRFTVSGQQKFLQQNLPWKKQPGTVQRSAFQVCFDWCGFWNPEILAILKGMELLGVRIPKGNPPNTTQTWTSMKQWTVSTVPLFVGSCSSSCSSSSFSL